MSGSDKQWSAFQMCYAEAAGAYQDLGQAQSKLRMALDDALVCLKWAEADALRMSKVLDKLGSDICPTGKTPMPLYDFMQHNLERDYSVLLGSIAASETREQAESFLDESIKLLEYHDALHACALKAWHARRRELAAPKGDQANDGNSNPKVDYP